MLSATIICNTSHVLLLVTSFTDDGDTLHTLHSMLGRTSQIKVTLETSNPQPRIMRAAVKLYGISNIQNKMRYFTKSNVFHGEYFQFFLPFPHLEANFPVCKSSLQYRVSNDTVSTLFSLYSRVLEHIHSHWIAQKILIPKLTLLSILREKFTKLQHKM